MRFGKKPPPKKIDNPEADLLSAMRDIGKEHQKDVRRKSKKKGPSFLNFVPGWAKNIAIAVLIVLVVLIADGIRRESKEFSASLGSFTGTCMVLKSGDTAPIVPTENMALLDRDLVSTGAYSTATILFSDGSAVQLEPSTAFRVRLMDYARGGKRDRSFMVESGGVIARVSKFFGVDSRATVCTPNAVAAARGTGFRVSYDPQSGATGLQVVDGTVLFTSGYNSMPSTPGQMAGAIGYNMTQAKMMSQNVRAPVMLAVGTMSSYEKPPNALQKIEQAINNFLDPVLQVFGLCPGGWGYNSVDFARRGACMEALRRLRTHVEESYKNGVPDYINTVTLQELSLNSKETNQLLDAFYGDMLESYQKTSQETYAVYARARDKKHTLYKLTESTLEVVPE